MNLTLFFFFLGGFFQRNLYLYSAPVSLKISVLLLDQFKNQVIKIEKSNDQKKFRKNWYFWSIIFSTRLLVTWNVKIRSDWLIGRWLNWKIFLLISNSQMCYGSIPTFIKLFMVSYLSIFLSLIFSFWTRNPKILKNFSIQKTNFSYVFIFELVWWYEKGKSKDFVKIIFSHGWIIFGRTQNVTSQFEINYQ